MEKLWSKDYVLNIVGNLLLFVVFYLLMVYTTKLAITEFNVSVSEAGLASGIFIVGALIARLVVSRYMVSLVEKDVNHCSSNSCYMYIWLSFY